MKTKLLFFSLIFSLASQAQCVRSGTFVANSPDTMTYPISGTANITEATDGTLSVNFESDFVSVQGFQLQTFLSTTQNLNMGAPGTFLRVDQDGDLVCNPHGSFERSHNEEPMTGAITFTGDLTGVNINDYQYVILQCVEFGVPWGYAPLGAISGNCPSLSISETELSQNVNLFPNPIQDKVKISNERQLDLNITVVDILGKSVLNINNISTRNETFDVSSLKSGLYLVKIEAEGSVITKRLVKQ